MRAIFQWSQDAADLLWPDIKEHGAQVYCLDGVQPGDEPDQTCRASERREDPIFISCASLHGNTQMWKLEKTKRKTLRQRAVQIKIV